MAHANVNESKIDARDDWWHVVAAVPVFTVIFLLPIILAGIDFTLFRFIQLALLLGYPVALLWDTRYVRLFETDWQPSKWRYALLGVAVLFTGGLLSFIVSPYYLYKRRKYVEVP